MKKCSLFEKQNSIKLLTVLHGQKPSQKKQMIAKSRLKIGRPIRTKVGYSRTDAGTCQRTI